MIPGDYAGGLRRGVNVDSWVVPSCQIRRSLSNYPQMVERQLTFVVGLGCLCFVAPDPCLTRLHMLARSSMFLSALAVPILIVRVIICRSLLSCFIHTQKQYLGCDSNIRRGVPSQTPRNAMSCSLTRSAGSKDGVVGGLLTLFSSDNRWSVAGEPAIPTTDVLTLLAQLPQEFPKGKCLQHGIVEEAFKACAARRGADLDLARPITRNAKGSSRLPSCAFTASEITAFLWDQIVFELIKKMRCLSSGSTTLLGVKRPRDEHSVFVDPVVGASVKLDSDLRQAARPRGGRTVWPSCTEEFNVSARVVVSGLPNPPIGYLTAISVDACAEEIATMCCCGLGVSIDEAHVRARIAPLCMDTVEPSVFLAHTLLRCECMTEIVGVTLSKQMLGYMHARNFDRDHTEPDRDTVSSLLQELIQTRATLNKYTELASTGAYSVLTSLVGTSTVLTTSSMSATSKSARALTRERTSAIAHAMVNYAAKLNIAFRHVKNSVVDAGAVHSVALGHGEQLSTEYYKATDALVTDKALRRYTCYIDQAIDMYLADRIAQALKHRTAIGGLPGVVCLVVWVVVVTSLLRI